MVHWFQKLCIFGFGAVLILIITLAYVFYRLPEGVVFEGHDLGGLSHREARKIVAQVLDLARGNTFAVRRTDGVEQVFTPQDLGVYFDLQKTYNTLMHKAYPFLPPLSRAAENQAAVSMHVDQNIFHENLSTYLLLGERLPENAAVIWSDTEWSIVPEKSGTRLASGETERITGMINTSLYPPQPLVLNASYQIVEPDVTAESLRDLTSSANRLSRRIVEIYLGKKIEVTFKLTSEWLVLDEKAKTISLNETKAKDWIAAFARLHDTEPGIATVTSIAEEVSEYDAKPIKRAVIEGSLEHGKKIDQQKFLDDLKAIVNDPKVKAFINPEYIDTPPKVNSIVEGMSFGQVVSTGKSSFRLGNYAARRVNIEKSLGSFRGIILNPGEELSFNRVTGWVTPKKGYTLTKVIVDGEVVEGIGGGVCQSSTTMYRAAINAGFPVTERRNHTIDVEYYHMYGYGIDAAVYTDSRADLRFVNDSPTPILINTYLTDTFDAVVDFFGVPDGRMVELINIPTGNYLLKKWSWKITKSDGVTEERSIISKYREPKPKEETLQTGDLPEVSAH